MCMKQFEQTFQTEFLVAFLELNKPFPSRQRLIILVILKLILKSMKQLNKLSYI